MPHEHKSGTGTKYQMVPEKQQHIIVYWNTDLKWKYSSFSLSQGQTKCSF